MTTVGIIGLDYVGLPLAVGDMRESPALKILELLKQAVRRADGLFFGGDGSLPWRGRSC